MRELLAELTKSLHQGRHCVYCSIVETRGSTPQKAGAAMLVYLDGSQTGTLGGGCVEAEVKQRALRVLNDGGGRAEVLTFNLDDDYGWDDGLICGGRMTILADPLVRGPASVVPGNQHSTTDNGQRTKDYYQRFYQLVEQGQGCTEAVVVNDQPGLPIGNRYLFDAEGQVVVQ